MAKLKEIPQRLGYILGAQWTRDLSWTLFTILLARHSQATLGQIMLALSYGYLCKTVADVGLNDYLRSTFARNQYPPRELLAEVTWLKSAFLVLALAGVWLTTGMQGYTTELRLIVLCIAAGFGLDGVSDSFFALCQARGRHDVEMRLRIPAALLGIGYGIVLVLLQAPPLYVALFKLIESVICIICACVALRRAPAVRLGWAGLRDLAGKMRNGLVFTGMAVCAMVYNKLNVFFLKQYGGDAAVGGYSVAWETVEGLSTLISSALLGKVIFPLLSKLWREDKEEFRRISGQTARSLWAAALPIIFLICVESDRFLTLIYGDAYSTAVTAQRLLTPCLATAFLHNLAAYAMMAMQRERQLFWFYVSGLVVNIALCFWLIPLMPLEGAALSLTGAKVWVAILTVSIFQWTAHPMTGGQWALMTGVACFAVALWYGLQPFVPREIAELAGLLPLLALFWHWRPPSMFDKQTQQKTA